MLFLFGVLPSNRTVRKIVVICYRENLYFNCLQHMCCFMSGLNWNPEIEHRSVVSNHCKWLKNSFASVLSCLSDGVLQKGTTIFYGVFYFSHLAKTRFTSPSFDLTWNEIWSLRTLWFYMLICFLSPLFQTRRVHGTPAAFFCAWYRRESGSGVLGLGPPSRRCRLAEWWVPGIGNK